MEPHLCTLCLHAPQIKPKPWLRLFFMRFPIPPSSASMPCAPPCYLGLGVSQVPAYRYVRRQNDALLALSSSLATEGKWKLGRGHPITSQPVPRYDRLMIRALYPRLANSTICSCCVVVNRKPDHTDQLYCSPKLIKVCLSICPIAIRLDRHFGISLEHSDLFRMAYREVPSCRLPKITDDW